MKKLPSPWMLLAAVSLLGGACSTVQTAPPLTIDGKVATTEYKYVKVTGSLIPVRVPIDPSVRPLVNANPVTNISAEDFEKIVARGQTNSSGR
ncbi:MAG: hypothetical protein EXS32_09670 [Opitutus sp.]|nr:hypothetical protein [Opitutus sp.]